MNHSVQIPRFGIFVTDREKHLYNVETDNTGISVKLHFFELENGYACYVNAHCESKFDADAAVILRPEMVETDRYLAIHNHSEIWCRPFWGTSLSALPVRTQELLIDLGDGRFGCWLPICDDTYKTLIRGRGEEEGMELYLYSNVDSLDVCENQLAYLYKEGSDPLQLMREIAVDAAKLLDNGLRLREERFYPDVFEHLGWCSWDALQIRVSHQGLLEKAREFSQKQVPIHFAIIDDMWADAPDLNKIPEDVSFGDMVKAMHASKLRTFSGDPVRFPDGMQAAIEDMKEAGIPKVGVWFPTTGYWSGLMPDGYEARAQAGRTVESTKDARIVVAPEADAANAFYGDLCGRIKNWGGDFVKIDYQGFFVKHYRNLSPVGRVSRCVQRAIDHATAEHFDRALINCMGMNSECMFNRPESAVSRCSDDFMPESPEWFSKNILQCAYNGLLQGQFYVNDWDMWWTDDAQAEKNSICRAVSGGPIYVSDKIGRTRPEILKPVCFGDGRLPRCDKSATPTADCLIQNPTQSGKIFKVFNRKGEASVVAVFNIDAEKRSVSGSLSPSELGLPAGDYVLYEHFSSNLQMLSADQSIAITLPTNGDYRLYTVVPRHPSGVTFLGRSDLFIGIGALIAREGNTFRLYEGGEVAFATDCKIRIGTATRDLPLRVSGQLVRTVCGAEETELTVAFE